MTVLMALLLVWGGLLAWFGLGAEEPQQVPLVNVSGRPGGETLAHGRPADDSLRVNLALLQASRAARAADVTSPKNIFELRQPGSVAPSPPPPPPEEVEEEEVPPPAVTLPPVPDTGLAELTEFRYLGYMELKRHLQDGSRVALLAKRERLHTVRRGDLIGSAILVKAITPTSVTLQHTGTEVEHELSLVSGSPEP